MKSSSPRLKSILIIVLALSGIVSLGCDGQDGAGSSGKLDVFAGVANKTPLEMAARVFERETGIGISLRTGGSGAVLSQMVTAKLGDVYVPSSEDFMDRAVELGAVDPESRRVVAYLIPTIAVQKGNPKDVKSLSDFTRSDVKVAIANPDVVSLGRYSKAIFRKSEEVRGEPGLVEEIEARIVTHAKNAEHAAQLLVLGQVDAVIGYRIFQEWNRDTIDLVPLDPQEIPKIGTIWVGVSTYARDGQRATRFVDFLTSEDGRKIYSQMGFVVEAEEARRWAPLSQAQRSPQ